MLVSAITAPSNLNLHGYNLHFCSNSYKDHHCYKLNASSVRPFLLTKASSSIANNNDTFLQNPNSNTLRHVIHTDDSDEESDGVMFSSASAVAAAIRSATTSPVDFIQRIEKNQKSGLVLPSADFQRLCVEQLGLFRRIVDPDALLSVYVRPAGSYVMDRLELRRVTLYPGVCAPDIVILVGNFSIPTGLRAAEAALSSQQVVIIPEHRALVFPMVKPPFIVGFLVAEIPKMEIEACNNLPQSDNSDLAHSPFSEETYALPPVSDFKLWEVQTLKHKPVDTYNFTAEQKSNAINISRSLAMAYVMDQKAMLLQQSSWQNNVRMSNLVEQIRGPLSSIRTLSKMLSLNMKQSEISYDIVEDIIEQGNFIRETLQQLQDAVYMTKANLMRYNEEALKKMHNSTHAHPELGRSMLPEKFSGENSSNKVKKSGESFAGSSVTKDLEMPMPPLALAPLQQHQIRPCIVADVLAELVGAVQPLAHNQGRVVELSELSLSLEVAVEEPALRQALSNLIEGALLRTHVGGKVEIVSSGAPAGGVLVVIDDDGPDMHYMTQMHSLTPFGEGLLSEDRVEDNMTWNFVAGLTVAREILESYGCVVRVMSPRITDAALGAGGTRIELWLPSFTALSDSEGPSHEV